MAFFLFILKMLPWSVVNVWDVIDLSAVGVIHELSSSRTIHFNWTLLLDPENKNIRFVTCIIDFFLCNDAINDFASKVYKVLLYKCYVLYIM